MRPKRALRNIAQVLVGALMFTQAALAIAACDWLGHAPAQAIAQSAAPPCHQSEPRADNLCVAQCVAGFQSLDTHQLPVFALPTGPVLEVRTPSSSSMSLVSHPTRVVPPSAGPPPRILFHQFLI